MRRRPTSAPDVVVLTPRHAGADLPPFVPGPAPAGGWTLAAALVASRAYADEHDLGSTGATRAFQALAAHDDPRPRGRDAAAGWVPRLRREELRARLCGAPDEHTTSEPSPRTAPTIPRVRLDVAPRAGGNPRRWSGS